MRKIVDFIQWAGLAIVNVISRPIEKVTDILSRWLLEDEEEDDGDNWPFGGY